MKPIHWTSLISSILFASAGCASMQDPGEFSREALGELADIHRMVDDRDASPTPEDSALKADSPVCMMDGMENEPRGYVVFEPGTADPVGYAGAFGACIREPMIPSPYSGVQSLRCNRLRDSTIEIHSFADPEKVDGESSAEEVSRKRMRLIERRLDGTAVPNDVARTTVHTSGPKDLPLSLVEREVGIQFSPAGCRDGPAQDPREVSHAARRSIPGKLGGPMSWLNYHEPEDFIWEDISTEYLDGRFLVYRRERKNAPSRIVVIDENRAVCREQEVTSSGVVAEGEILFEPGTSTPIAYTGAGRCLTERPLEDPGLREFGCDFPRNSMVYLEGHGPNNLSQTRLDVVEKHLSQSALPSDVMDAIARGTDVLDASEDGEDPTLGVTIHVVDPLIFMSPKGIQYHQTVGPAWTETQLEEFSAFMKKWVDSKGTAIERNWPLHVRYQDAYDFVQTFSAPENPDETVGLNTFLKWVDAMFENGCNTEEVGLPSKFLPDDTRGPQSTIDFPNSSASSSEMSSSSS